eukprot:Protomagalhaensia_wolfi_Nauph_80__5209@NODE_55_length_4132_cov_174_239922_g46_i0_p2_GENE_NODE_55_length_4132_cov_174_239922_g46_i0NODE_55_length_4132_cov_174_239922_g46_i0_p2_ORF_typecomplete_len259_score28_06_NODE_55_length_4132_cov_174_239922_g46_i026793455
MKINCVLSIYLAALAGLSRGEILASTNLVAVAEEGATTTTISIETQSFSANETRCFQLRADKSVKLLNEPGAAVTITIPDSVLADPVQLMRFQAQNGFIDAEDDGVERFRFTLVCRCWNVSDTESHILHKAHLGEVPCEGSLKGGFIRYSLPPQRLGQCFVASQQLHQAGPGSLTRYFLKLRHGASVPGVVLDPNRSYFHGGDFRLHRYTYADVCNQDVDFWDRQPRGPHEQPLLHEGTHPPKAVYENNVIDKTIFVN